MAASLDPLSPLSPLPVASFRVIPPPGRKRTRSIDWVEDHSLKSGDDEDDEDRLEDAAFEQRHHPLEQIERKGFSVVTLIERKGVTRAKPAVERKAPSGDEREIRRSVQMLLGKPPTSVCPACPPYFKHVAHTCEKARDAAAPDDASGSETGCPACPPLCRHVAHTCGKTYVGKRYGKRRKKGGGKASAPADTPMHADMDDEDELAALESVVTPSVAEIEMALNVASSGMEPAEDAAPHLGEEESEHRSVEWHQEWQKEKSHR